MIYRFRTEAGQEERMSVNFKNRKSEEGMTLVELIIVVVILGMLVAALSWTLLGRLGQSREQIAKIEISQIDGNLSIYMIDVGNYPQQGVGLEALVENTTGSSNWRGPYLKKMPVDPWGNPYVYTFPSMHSMDYDLCSAGADGVDGSEDDICNWK
jgi:general secretion pathway protein G